MPPCAPAVPALCPLRAMGLPVGRAGRPPCSWPSRALRPSDACVALQCGRDVCVMTGSTEPSVQDAAAAGAPGAAGAGVWAWPLLHCLWPGRPHQASGQLGVTLLAAYYSLLKPPSRFASWRIYALQLVNSDIAVMGPSRGPVRCWCLVGDVAVSSLPLHTVTAPSRAAGRVGSREVQLRTLGLRPPPPGPRAPP